MHAIKFRAAIAAVALVAASASAALAKPVDPPITEADLAAHMRVLASDAFEGRAPGTEGEDRTIAYIVGEWAKAGLEPVAGSDTPWLQPVPLVESGGVSGSVKFKVRGRAFALRDDSIVLTGRDASLALADVPVVFVGYGVDASGKVAADVKGKVAILLSDAVPFGEKMPRYRDRRQMLADAGATAVLVVASDTLPWAAVQGSFGSQTTKLAGAKPGAAATGFIAAPALQALLTKVGKPAVAALEAAKSADYRGTDLAVTADLSAETEVRPYASHNVIAKLPGAKPDGKVVLYLGHWDHLGICGDAGEADRICNGAVDNASGIAVLTEVAKRLASGPRPDRDIYFMATTAEEKGLLGAHYFADHPVVPLTDITVALNIDTIAISPRGTPVATIGRGRPAYDAVVRKVSTDLGRKLDEDGEADAFVQRQDGWALGGKGVVSLMVGGSFSDMPLLEKFLGSDYHTAADNFSDAIPLGGAAEDADLHVALGRVFADTKAWSGTEK
ncbi:MAG: M28 family peptidase [Sphingopyxis sp.]|uniref:M28 family peptidase n=1 Tax=Sphingopyxis sp. TaxID=1908224 RepID=UPI003D6D6707